MDLCKHLIYLVLVCVLISLYDSFRYHVVQDGQTSISLSSRLLSQRTAFCALALLISSLTLYNYFLVLLEETKYQIWIIRI